VTCLMDLPKRVVESSSTITCASSYDGSCDQGHGPFSRGWGSILIATLASDLNSLAVNLHPRNQDTAAMLVDSRNLIDWRVALQNLGSEFPLRTYSKDLVFLF